MKSNKHSIFFYKNKRSFLLIEVVIAFALITLLIVPLIRNPIYFFRSQIKSLETLECERIADLTFLDLKIAILEKKIPTKNLETRKDKTKYVTLKSYLLETFKNKEIKRSYKLYSARRKEKQTINNEKYKLLNIRIFLRPIDQKKKYEYEYKMLCKTK